ncbi:unnamed protein product, partial [Polarella glacialis]
ERHIRQRSPSPTPNAALLSPALSLRRSRSFMDLVVDNRPGAPDPVRHSRPVPANLLDNVVARLPTMRMPADRTSEPCTICLEVPSCGEVVTTLQCCHWYHTDCIREWLVHSRLCPLCKALAVPDELVQ